MIKNILLIYPESPSTFWSLDHTLEMVNKKSLMPPLGLMTIAAMIPDGYNLRLIDMNVRNLTEKDLAWSDMVFLSAMIIHKVSFSRVVNMCNKLKVPVTAGGPYITSSFETISGVDHFLLGEGESLIPQFFSDLKNGNLAKIYSSETRPDIKLSPIPRFDLIDVNDYGSMPLQFSRGCPFSCEFCDIIEMFGRVPRLKSVEQFILELEAVYMSGFRGLVFIVDDNFIGNRGEALRLLRAIKLWQEEKSFPFTFFTEASIDISFEKEILELMSECAFTMLFIGIETPDENTLAAVNKKQNIRSGIIESVRIIQSKGIEVIAGFIIGFDTDKDNIFDRQIKFIQEAGIPMAMTGIMLALPGTELYRRLEKEGRILHSSGGNNTDIFDLNYIPVMDKEKIFEGYKKIITTLYSPKKYFDRSLTLLLNIPSKVYKKRRLRANDIKAFLRSFFIFVQSRYILSYLHYLFRVLANKPSNFPHAVILSINGYHFFEISREMYGINSNRRIRYGYYSEKTSDGRNLQSDNYTV